MKMSKKMALLASSVLASLWSIPVHAGSVTVTGVYNGNPGVSGVQYTGQYPPDYDNGATTYSADNGTGAYTDSPGNTYTFTASVSATGGNGGSITATDNPSNYPNDIYFSGNGGDGVDLEYGNTAVFNGGTYTGGNGGTAAGTANQFIAGGGGIGLSASGLVQINGGSFTGGAVGEVTGVSNQPAPFGLVGGEGVSLGVNTTVNITGGTFTGGAGSTGGVAGPGLFATGGAANIYGGEFLSGLPTFPGNGLFDDGIFLFGGTVTLYGSDFEVDGAPVGDGSISEYDGTITGQLEDNATATSITFVNDGGTINLVSVPEPATVGLLFAAAMLGLARRRRLA